MEIYERLCLLRKNILKDNLGKKYSRNDFAEKIGVSRGVIENIEYNRVEAKDHIIKLICQTFNVNEDWLRNGNEPIFIEKENDVLEELIKEYELSEFMADIFKRYLNLDKNYQLMFEKFIKELTKDLGISSNSVVKMPQKSVKIVARGQGVTEMPKEEFDRITETAVKLDPNDYDNYF